MSNTHGNLNSQNISKGSKKRPAHYIPLFGTWGERNQWWRTDSKFAEFARQHNIIPYHKRPFEWSGDLDGGLLDVFSKRKHRDWKACGAAISYYFDTIAYSDRNVIGHSHVIQGLAYAAKDYGLQLKNLITVSPPVRNDLREGYVEIGKLTNNWLNIHDSEEDWIRYLGTWFDGKGGNHKIIPHAVNHSLPDINHSKILDTEMYFPLWVSQGWFDYLRL